MFTPILILSLLFFAPPGQATDNVDYRLCRAVLAEKPGVTYKLAIPPIEHTAEQITRYSNFKPYALQQVSRFYPSAKVESLSDLGSSFGPDAINPLVYELSMMVRSHLEYKKSLAKDMVVTIDNLVRTYGISNLHKVSLRAFVSKNLRDVLYVLRQDDPSQRWPGIRIVDNGSNLFVGLYYDVKKSMGLMQTIQLSIKSNFQSEQSTILEQVKAPAHKQFAGVWFGHRRRDLQLANISVGSDVHSYDLKAAWQPRFGVVSSDGEVNAHPLANASIVDFPAGDDVLQENHDQSNLFVAGLWLVLNSDFVLESPQN